MSGIIAWERLIRTAMLSSSLTHCQCLRQALRQAETQGMGIAVDYISGANRPDIIACYLYNPPGENQGIYFMGEHLLAWP